MLCFKISIHFIPNEWKSFIHEFQHLKGKSLSFRVIVWNRKHLLLLNETGWALKDEPVVEVAIWLEILLNLENWVVFKYFLGHIF